MSTVTQQGINALKLGNRVKAQAILKQATAQNPQDVQAWLWLSGAVENDQERLRCLQKVLAIDPGNTAAAKGLAKLIADGIVQVQTSSTGKLLQTADKPSNVAPQKQKVRSEKVLFEVKPSIIPFVIALILSGLLLISVIWMIGKVLNSPTSNLLLNFLVVIVFGSLYWKIGIAFLKSSFTRYTLTTEHLIVKTGVLSYRQKTIPLQKIQDVSFQQPFLLRLFGVGNVIVESAGERGEIKLSALADCEKRSRQILQVVKKYR